MEQNEKPKQKTSPRTTAVWLAAGLTLTVVALFAYAQFRNIPAIPPEPAVRAQVESAQEPPKGLTMPELDTAAYDAKLLAIANSSSTATGVPLWPAKTAYPNAGALLPFNRVVAYYGNLYSKNMGILGEYGEDEVLRRLEKEVKTWQEADPQTPVVPALHYIAVVAQAGAGRDGKYRARMPDKEIDKVLAMADKIHALVFLDIQVGKSTLEAELQVFEKYLKLPNVHLGIDPEFSMKNGRPPGTSIGTMDAQDVNFAARHLAEIVKNNNLPPKILVVHRFTQKMLTNYQNIKPLPETQIVINMDGFGGQGNKLNTYKQYVYKEPVQFAGFKLFYKNDATRGPLLSPAQLLKLTPIPSYIQYQ